jgi:dTDP-4-amino-4,6-dideoxygalactose transaminase
MRKTFLPFALPDIRSEEIEEVVSSLKSGWLTTGPKTKQFEKEFSDFIGGNRESIAVNSATAGLHLALEAAGIEEGDEVITTPFTFTSTAEVICYLKAHPVFVDIDPTTLNLNHQLIEKAITPRTKAIIPVHFAGLPCEMDIILSIAEAKGLKVIEDAAHALPCSYNRQMIGTLKSDATVYSFYATKTIATGEGGMIVTNDEVLAKRCQIMRLHGINKDVFDRYVTNKPSWYYEVIAPGFKYNMPDIAASIGIHQLRKAWEFQKKREEIASCYHEAFADLPLVLPPIGKQGDVHAWHLYVIQLKANAKVDRNTFIERMYEKQIGCSVHFIPLHLHPYWKNTYHLKPNDFPCALKVYQNVVSLPIYTKMTQADIADVINAVREILT